MTRLERDIVCGQAERLGLPYRRAFGYAVDIDGYIFISFREAIAFVETRTLPQSRFEKLVKRFLRGAPSGP